MWTPTSPPSARHPLRRVLAPRDSAGVATVTNDPNELNAVAQQFAFLREETQFEIRLLHDRVGAVLAAEAFLTIAYTAAMSNGTSWGATFSMVVAPMLSILGLVIATLAWPGVDATVKLVLELTDRQGELLAENPHLSGTVRGRVALGRGGNRAVSDQRRSMLVFRAVPVLFVLLWFALTVVALVIHR